ncbi:MAG: aldehyde dehydrogenase family protein [Saprospiraceae bacterium]
MSDVLSTTRADINKPTFKNQYDNFIGGKWVAPVKGEYFENISPVDGKSFTKIARSTAEDIELALDAAWAAAPAWNSQPQLTEAMSFEDCRCNGAKPGCSCQSGDLGQRKTFTVKPRMQICLWLLTTSDILPE